jgi:ethanolamine ammonia-lyase large subunit
MLNTNTLPALVDELTDLSTQIAALTARADEIKATLVKTGLNEVCGLNTRAVISTVADGVTTDYKAAITALLPNADLTAFAKKRSGYTKVEIKGYNARNLRKVA